MRRLVCFGRVLVIALLLLLAVSTSVHPAHAATANILINEFMPAPSSGAEWVELFNPTGEAIAIGGWKIVDDTLSHTQTIISANTTLPPNGLLVVFLSTNILNN